MKMAKKKRLVVAVFLGLGLLLAGLSASYAHFGTRWASDCGNADEHVDWIRYHLSQKLDLDPSQQQKLETMARELLAKANEVHQLKTSTRQEVIGILRADTVDAVRIEQLAAQRREEVSGLITEASSKLVEFVGILTPEQRERLAKLIEDHADCSH